MLDRTKYWCKILTKTGLCFLKWHVWQIFVSRLKNSDFILESKMGELNQNQNQNNQIDQIQCENFVLPWK